MTFFQKSRYGLIIVACVILAGCNQTGIVQQSPSPTPITSSTRGKIQLGTFSLAPAATKNPTPPATPIPPQGPSCPEGEGGTISPSGGAANCTCEPPEHVEDCPAYGANCRSPGFGMGFLVGRYCFAKPVIYLYPTQDTIVNVRLVIPGQIIVSDPRYPENGWTVLAHPNGQLDYLGKKYSELYYESTVDVYKKPKNGVVFTTRNLVSMLRLLTNQLGLNQNEQDEFLLYWLPKLQSLNSPYILFSVLDPMTKDQIDHVQISPQPDTQIQFLVYFKPLQNPIQVPPLILPPTPVRKGFTSVEWGGTIDQTPVETNGLLNLLF